MDFEIRNVEERDLLQVAEIVINDWKIAYRGIIDDAYLDNLDVQAKYERFKQNYQEGHFTVAVRGSEVLGFARYSDEPFNNSDNKKVECELCALYVKWDVRGSGIGAALVTYVKDYFKSIGKKSMCIWCLKENHKARFFYEKMGGTLYAEQDLERGGKIYKEVGYMYEL